MTDRPIKVLIAKPGLDGHDRGAKVLARGPARRGLRGRLHGPPPDARDDRDGGAPGGRRRRRPVDPVGRPHDARAADHASCCASEGMDDVLVTVGGIIPDDDVPALKEAGVAAVFGPGTTIARGRRLPAGERATARLAVGGRARPPSRAAALCDAAVDGRPAALARLLTAVENRTPVAEAALRAALPAGRPGPPRRDHRAAGRRQVHARRGADRRGSARRAGRSRWSPSTRPARSPAARSSATASGCRPTPSDATSSSARWPSRGHAGGLAATSTAAAAVLDAAGFDLVLHRDRRDGPERGRGRGRGRHDGRPRGARDGRRGPGDQGRPARGRRPRRRQQGRPARARSGPRRSCGRCSSPTAPRERLRPGPARARSGPEVLITTALDRRRRPGAARRARPPRAGGRRRPRAPRRRLARAEAQVWAILADRLRGRLDEPRVRRGPRRTRSCRRSPATGSIRTPPPTSCWPRLDGDRPAGR